LDKGCKMKIIWNKIKKNIDRELNKLTLKDLI
jgi:DNA-binding IscR family transcriptional regulator